MYLKEEEITNEINKLSFPPFNINIKEDFSNLGEPLNRSEFKVYKPDLLLELEWKGLKQLFLAEVVKISSPKIINEALGALQRFMNKLNRDKNRYWPIIIAPYLSPEILAQLEEEGISGVDLCGNGLIQIPGKWLVSRTGQQNRFTSNAPIKNIFTGATSLVARAFFSRSEYLSVNDLHNEIIKRGGKISLSTISKALKVLTEEMLIIRGETIKLANASKLLNSLTNNYPGIPVKARVRGKLPNIAEQYVLINKVAKRKNVQIAGYQPELFTIMPSVEPVLPIYTTSIKQLTVELDFQETAQFPNVEFIETDAVEIYFDCVARDDFSWFSPLQIYLVLKNRGKREQESAEPIGKNLIELRYAENL